MDASGFWLPWLLLVTHCCLLALGLQRVTNPRIVEHPESQYVARNEPATLNCKAESEPPPVITWYRDGQLVETSLHSTSSHRMLLPSGQLFFLRIIHSRNSRMDVGTYYCNATNPETKVSAISHNATLKIAVLRDEFRESPRNTEVALGELAKLLCRPPVGLPEPSVHWLRNNQQIQPGDSVRISADGNLLVNDARKRDAGMYICVARNVAGERSSNPVQLYVREKPALVKSPSDMQIEEGETVQFDCHASGDPRPTIVWKKERGQITSSRSRILDNRSLKIESVQISDEGVYICRAENSVGHVEASAKLTVHSHPSFVVTPKDKVVGLGRRVTFRCEASGNPVPAVYWNRETSETLMFPHQDHGRFSVTNTGTLAIERVHESDAGEYICQALSVAGSAYCKATLHVKEIDPRPPPIIYEGPQNQTLPVNSLAMLRCASSGNPPPIISWYKNQQLIRMFDPRVALLDTGTLQISDLQLTDTAMYTCKAYSETGETAWSAALVVEEQTNPNVIFHRTPEPTTFPGSPSRPHISDISDTHIRLSWKANTNHGASPVSAYTVEYFSHETGEGWVVATDSVTEQRYTVRHLRPDTSYMFLIRAKNTHGLSLPSEVSEPVSTTGGSGVKPTLFPYDPQLVADKLSGNIVVLKSPDALSSTAVKVNWEVRKSQRYIEGFHMKYRVMPDSQRRPGNTPGAQRHDDYAVETVTGSGATMYVLRKLRKFTWYEIRVQPFYGRYEGQQSNVMRVRTLEDVPSAPPQGIIAKMQRNNSLYLSWTPPPFEELNGPLRGYKVFLYGNESRYHREVKTNVTVKSVVLVNLTEGVVYRVQIAGWNRMGVGAKSNSIVIGGDNGMVKSIVREPWFIVTLICTIGGTLWIALCIFSVWLYRKRCALRKLKKGSSLNVPVRMNDSVRCPQQQSSYACNTPPTTNAQCRVKGDCIANTSITDCPTTATQHQACLCSCHCKRASPQQMPLEALRPDVANVHGGNMPPGAACDKNTMFNPSEPLRTFYNKDDPCDGPYATTTLIGSASRQPANTANNVFRPIQNGYEPSNRSITEAMPLLPENPVGADGFGTYHPASPSSDYSGMAAEETVPMLQHQPQQKQRKLTSPPKQPVLFLPPPPEHPPPSDIGTPPDSPTFDNISAPYGHYRTQGYAPPIYDSVQGQRHRGSQGRPHRYAPPRAMSEPDRGPTPPVRAYKLVPLAERHCSDTDGVPQPPQRRMLGSASPPSPAPRDNRANDSDPEPMAVDYDDGVYSPQDDLPDPSGLLDYYGDDSHHVQSPTSSLGDSGGQGWHGGSPTAVGAPESPPHSSEEEDSDASFLADADFAVAVAKAAELSGLTVVGSTVVDPNAGQEREKVRRTYKQRDRARRPSSPYSTDSNYSSVAPPPRPYPKSERRRQMQDPTKGRASSTDNGGTKPQQQQQRPVVKSKPPHVPQHVADLPSYYKPSFPTASGNNSSGSGTAKPRGATTPSHASAESDNSVLINPLAAFDTRNTPIV